jgi:hypothetical protein
MVVLFGRVTFKLDEDLVALALQAATSGFCSDQLVSYVKVTVFSFIVSCKYVCFMVLGLESFI